MTRNITRDWVVIDGAGEFIRYKDDGLIKGWVGGGGGTGPFYHPLFGVNAHIDWEV
jgi:hypothetical protein